MIMNRMGALFALLLTILYLFGLCSSQSAPEYNGDGRIKRSPQMPPMPPGMPQMPPGMPPMPSVDAAQNNRVVRQAPPAPPDSPPGTRIARQAPSFPDSIPSKRVERQAPQSPPDGPPSKRVERQAPPPPPPPPNRFVRQTNQSKMVLESFYVRSKREARGRGTGSMPTKTG